MNTKQCLNALSKWAEKFGKYGRFQLTYHPREPIGHLVKYTWTCKVSNGHDDDDTNYLEFVGYGTTADFALMDCYQCYHLLLNK